MSFSPEWLRLREPVDNRSRDLVLARRLKAHFADHNAVLVYDLGAGLGSNLRGTFRWLPRRQHWVLVDYDATLIAAAREEITRWADAAKSVDGVIEAMKDGRSLKIEFASRDLAENPDPWGRVAPDLVTAAALFDLVSAKWIGDFAAAVAASRAAFYTVLTHDGRSNWKPADPADGAMKAAFESHFGSDKGFGPAAGGDATHHLAEAFKREGYHVERAQSPWNLGDNDSELIAELAQGWARAVRETGKVPPKEVDAWIATRTQSGADWIVGHEDLLAIPPRH